MQSDLHPKGYRLMIFRDSASGQSFLTKSCANTNLNAVWEDGKEYPLYLMGISAFTHPFYTGQQKFVDTAGRVDKFQQRAAKTAGTIANQLQDEAHRGRDDAPLDDHLQARARDANAVAEFRIFAIEHPRGIRGCCHTKEGRADIHTEQGNCE
jgi:large subunit ribosomal protein L31